MWGEQTKKTMGTGRRDETNEQTNRIEIAQRHVALYVEGVEGRLLCVRVCVSDVAEGRESEREKGGEREFRWARGYLFSV